MRPILYMAGPYSLNPSHCTHAVLRTAEAVYEHTSWSPMVPHLTHFWDAVSPQPYGFWVDYDLDLLLACNAIIRLPGPSSGADRELDHAVANDMKVITFDDLDPIVERTYMTHMKGVLNHES